MIPVMQDKFAILDDDSLFVQRGSCFIACLASILEFPLSAIPRFELRYHESNWRVHMQHWLSYYGLEIIKLYHAPSEEDDAYYIVSGKSPRFNGVINHCCIWHQGKIVHDPHYDGTGVVDPYRWQLIKKVSK